MRIAKVLLDAPDQHHFVLDVYQQAHVRSAVVYSVLWRWLEYGWLEDGLEDGGRGLTLLRRRWYRLTALGRTSLTELYRRWEAAGREEVP
jgi:DNA-binding PadR family transcriptional regulator